MDGTTEYLREIHKIFHKKKLLHTLVGGGGTIVLDGRGGAEIAIAATPPSSWPTPPFGFNGIGNAPLAEKDIFRT